MVVKIGVMMALLAISCTSPELQTTEAKQAQKIDELDHDSINLSSFLEKNELLDILVDSVFNTLSEGEIVSQLIMPAAGRLGQNEDTILNLIRRKEIGGILLLNGSKEQFTTWTSKFEKMNAELGSLPFLYSADAEPSLVNNKIIGSSKVKKASALLTVEDVNACAASISKDLNDIGINYNFAPVADVSKNATVGYRGFGLKEENILPFCKAFIQTTQSQNIIATAKHFPGHGLVSGDTHKSLQMIEGELKELKYYPDLIANGVLSIMIAHIAVTNNEEFNTNGMPATTSEKIVTALLRDSLQFKGLIVTDAMNMGGVAKVKDADLLSIEAGCDVLLMPVDASESYRKLLKRYQNDPVFQARVEESAKRVIRMKLCLGLID